MSKSYKKRLEDLETEVRIMKGEQEENEKIQIFVDDDDWDGLKEFNIHKVIHMIMDYLGITIENKGDVVVRKEKAKEAKEK